MLPSIDRLQTYCIFLDFDGTLIEIQDHPDDVRVDDSTLRLIERLQDWAGGALALISGRDIDVIDRLLHPLVLPVAGVHGLQRRDAEGKLHSPINDQRIVDAVAADIESAFKEEPGIVIEKKTGAVALHYRLRPDFQERCHAVARALIQKRSELHFIEGKMVCEIRLDGSDKGAVIKSFLDERPFKGRKPIFAGDDATDENGFAAVNVCGGVTIKIGGGPTNASFHAGSVVELRNWLERLPAASRTSRVQ